LTAIDLHALRFLSTANIDRNMSGQLGHYLAGLIEADGCIVVSKNGRSPKGRKFYPSIEIVFHTDDLPLARLIRKVLGHGSIPIYKHAKACRLVIYNIEGVKKVVNLINGKMRTPKIEALNRLINYYNNQNEGVALPLLGIDESPLCSNAWFAGFVEGDGCFSLSVSSASLEKGRGYVSPRFSIDQKEKRGEKSNKELMNKIEETFGGTLRLRDRGNALMLTVTVSNKSALLILMNYLTHFPLFSSKRLNYLAWKESYYMTLRREYLTAEGFLKIKKIKDSMNSRRTEFNWDHLTEKEFYQ